MEVLALVEFLELNVTGLSLCHIGTNGEVLFVSFCDEIFEFLLNFDLSQTLL
jgi:hypothetical protein